MRYKEYNVNRVLEKSISLFWKKGFNGCTINDLVQTTGVNRFSLYHEFENKEGILYASLGLYRDRFCESNMAKLKSDESLVGVIGAFFMSFLNSSAPVSGCYFIHVGTELADSDPRVKESLDTYLKEIHILFRDLLLRHKYTETKADFAANHLVALYCTAMSFCLIHDRKEQERYLRNGINLIIANHA